MLRTVAGTFVALLLGAAAGCGQSAAPSASSNANPADAKPAESSASSTTTESKSAANVDPRLSPFVLSQEPEKPLSILAARKDVKDGDDVVLVGRIGGSESPMVKGRATFTIADTSFKPCNETGDDSCPTPWDYCCTEDVYKGVATIKFADADGKSLPVDVRDGMGLKELQTVVVQGKAKRDAEGNLTVLASGLFVRR